MKCLELFLWKSSFPHLLTSLFLDLYCIIQTYHLLCILPHPQFLFPFLVCFAFFCFSLFAKMSSTIFSNSFIEFISAIRCLASKSSSLFFECSHSLLKLISCTLFHECSVISLKFSSVPCLVSVSCSPFQCSGIFPGMVAGEEVSYLSLGWRPDSQGWERGASGEAPVLLQTFSWPFRGPRALSPILCWCLSTVDGHFSETFEGEESRNKTSSVYSRRLSNPSIRFWF